jgi:hypothetical protein
MKRIVALVVGLALLAPATAAAQSSTSCSSYNPPALCSASASRTPGSGTGSTTTSASSLPFTGLDVVLLLAGGATLLGAGLVVRILSRRLD